MEILFVRSRTHTTNKPPKIDPWRVPTPPITKPMIRSTASKKVKSWPATKPLSMHHMRPASEPSEALKAKFTVLYIGRFTPYTAAPASLSRIARTALPGRLRMMLRTSAMTIAVITSRIQ